MNEDNEKEKIENLLKKIQEDIENVSLDEFTLFFELLREDKFLLQQAGP